MRQGLAPTIPRTVWARAARPPRPTTPVAVPNDQFTHGVRRQRHRLRRRQRAWLRKKKIVEQFVEVSVAYLVAERRLKQHGEAAEQFFATGFQRLVFAQL